MSAKPINGILRAQRAVFDSDLTSPERLVLLAVLDHWSRKSKVPFPGVAALATKTALGRSTVMRAVRTLEAKGAISVERRHGVSNHYSLAERFNPGEPVSPRDQSHSETSSTVTPPPVSPRDHHQSHGDTLSNQPSNPVKKPKGRTKAKQAPIPDSWQPSQAHKTFAQEHELDLDLEAIKFRGYFEGREVASPNGRFATWLATALQHKRERGAPRAAHSTAGASKSFEQRMAQEVVCEH